MPGFAELILVLIIVLFIFGGSRLPQLAESFGKAITGFKKTSEKNDDKTG